MFNIKPGTNRIDKFRRSPLSHRKYLSYMHDLKSNYGSVMDYVRDERLQWTDMEPKAEAFHDPGRSTNLMSLVYWILILMAQMMLKSSTMIGPTA